MATPFGNRKGLVNCPHHFRPSRIYYLVAQNLRASIQFQNEISAGEEREFYDPTHVHYLTTHKYSDSGAGGENENGAGS